MELGLALSFLQGSAIHSHDHICTSSASFFFFFLVFLARLFPPASQSLVPSNYPLLQDPGGTAGTSAWSLTAGGYGELPAHVGKDLVQLRRIPSHIALAGKWEFEEGRGKCALRGNCEQPRPTRNPS